MKKFISIALIFIFLAMQANAHGFGFGFGYGFVDIPTTGGNTGEIIDNVNLGNPFEGLSGINSWDIPLPIIPPVINYPAKWNKLQDQHISKGSADYTMVYPDIKGQCNDPDDPEKFKIVPFIFSSNKYDLFFSGEDLLIKNLDSDYKGKDQIVVSCNGVFASFNLYINGYTGNYPAKWDDLHDVTIAKGSKDKTMIYEDLAKQCNDPDDAKIIKVTWDGDFKLYFSQYDLLIKKLDKDLTGTFPINLNCNGVKASFDLIISEYKRAFYENELMLSSIYIDDADHVKAGDVLPIYFTMKNSGDDKLENIRITAIIAELGARANIGPFDVREGKKTQKQLMLEIPEWTPAGTYYVAIYSSNNDVRRIKYREIIVTE